MYAFVPYTIDNQPYIIGGYLCTPLVKFPVSALLDTTPAAKPYRGTTIGEFGAGSRPIDMILYKKNGKDFLLMSNTNRGVMKIPTEGFAHGRADHDAGDERDRRRAVREGAGDGRRAAARSARCDALGRARGHQHGAESAGRRAPVGSTVAQCHIGDAGQGPGGAATLLRRSILFARRLFGLRRSRARSSFRADHASSRRQAARSRPTSRWAA